VDFLKQFIYLCFTWWTIYTQGPLLLLHTRPPFLGWRFTHWTPFPWREIFTLDPHFLAGDVHTGPPFLGGRYTHCTPISWREMYTLDPHYLHTGPPLPSHRTPITFTQGPPFRKSPHLQNVVCTPNKWLCCLCFIMASFEMSLALSLGPNIR